MRDGHEREKKYKNKKLQNVQKQRHHADGGAI